MKSQLVNSGFAMWRPSLSEVSRATLRDTVFRSGEAGTRCLLDLSPVRSVAQLVGQELIDACILGTSAVAIQAIAFDKSAETNWKVTWHQDLMFPFEKRVHSTGYVLASIKDGVDFARPPLEVLESLLAVRVHLDDCDTQNGPLRVCPGSHRVGIIPSGEIADHIASSVEVVCTAKEGEALLMRPLLLHASSKAIVPRHRRVLHLVFYSGVPIAEPWHRAIGPNSSPSPTAVGAGCHRLANTVFLR